MRTILVLSILLAILYVSPVIGPLAIFAKVGSILLLLVLAVVERGPASLVAALALGAAGDFFLAVRPMAGFNLDQLFMAGLVSFLIGHLFYIFLFLHNRTTTHAHSFRMTAVLNIILIAVFLVGVLAVIWPTLGGMRIPVLIYAAALTAMGISAQFSGFSELASLGALSFVISDAMLAFAHFGQPFPHAALFIWFTYYIAQAAICLSVLAHTYRLRSLQQ